MSGPRGGTRDTTVRRSGTRTHTTVRERSPGENPGQTNDTTYSYESDAGGDSGGSQSRGSRRSLPNPVRAGGKAASGGVGGLEAEFLGAICLLVVLMFADTQSAYSDKIMSFIKRGSLTCLLFFLLALIAGAGPNAARVTKGIGALIIVGLLVTAPVNDALSDIDSLIKNDWVGTSENDSANTASGTGSSNTGNAGSASTALNDAKKAVATLGGEQSGKTGIAASAKNAAQATLNGIIPGLGDLLGKI
jgi:hypothetical protein